MRRHDVFGKRVGYLKPMYIFIVSFLLILGTHFGMLEFQNHQLEQLIQEQTRVQREISQFINAQEVDYYRIDEIITILPTTYQPLHIESEINHLKNLHGLQLAANSTIAQSIVTQAPFSMTLPSTIRFVKIDMEFTTNQLDTVLEFLASLSEQNRLYYVSSVNINVLSSSNVKTNIVIYTFYNDVDQLY
jgi:hypothetical protein